ncbi:uncharacterized protein PB18E9.04c-like [Zingiber officinale]|uniref:uncharacterized protein PB18E9.04c-like n=1 Tax=Zingiber officinale TaxID=94328 RepID=UPI001C4B2AD8|nr:uncharacterized protein PB18E9.04c-like [Zingiber officinale]
MPLQSTNPSRPTSSPGRGRSRRSANVTYASLAIREASQAARQARSANDRSSRDTPSSSRRRVRLPSEDSESDDRPLAHKLRRRAPNPSQDSGPSTVPSPSPPVATTTPIPSREDAPPDPPEVPTEPPLAQPSTSQQHPSTEADPSHHPSPTTSTPEPFHVPPSAPSGSAVGPSQPPPPVHHHYRTTAPSEAGLRSRQDVSTSSFTMKGRLATLWEETVVASAFRKQSLSTVEGVVSYPVLVALATHDVTVGSSSVLEQELVVSPLFPGHLCTDTSWQSTPSLVSPGLPPVVIWVAKPVPSPVPYLPATNFWFRLIIVYCQRLGSNSTLGSSSHNFQQHSCCEK